jgi:plasmid stabilization system protein ParE
MQAIKRPRFLLDLADELTWLRAKAGPDVAERWYQSLLATMEDLMMHPHLGRERHDLKPAGIRSWRVKRYPRWLIFYSVCVNDELVFLRVRHGMMNLTRLRMEG